MITGGYPDVTLWMRQFEKANAIRRAAEWAKRAPDFVDRMHALSRDPALRQAIKKQGRPLELAATVVDDKQVSLTLDAKGRVYEDWSPSAPENSTTSIFAPNFTRIGIDARWLPTQLNRLVGEPIDVQRWRDALENVDDTVHRLRIRRADLFE